jgi:hypothetical protein
LITPTEVVITDLRRLEAQAEAAKHRLAGAAWTARPHRHGALHRLMAGVAAQAASLVVAFTVSPAGR